jgi:tRNA-2-methylthio-N6-dimethylallyladenosine synthase
VVDTQFLEASDYVFTDELDPSAKERVSAFVTIQKGCDNKCTFCIVPMTRGPELSRPSAEILAEVRALAAGSVREITLIGQTVNSYRFTDGGKTTRLADLLALLDAIDGLDRHRRFNDPGHFGEKAFNTFFPIFD